MMRHSSLMHPWGRGEELCFWDMVLRVRDHGELLIGYKPASLALDFNVSNKRQLYDSNTQNSLGNQYSQ
jgi:hypothetical protein